ncbi:MAG: hypothetical protein A2V66_00090 [Ignavibacteria bacterium RBG_13_36_8]|nr:MAG: hypothetical protein A2V66_00090 [Ignavibacteria bacterium RBG_13_36_8]
MRKNFIIVTIFLVFLSASEIPAQLAENSWGFGFGGVYPRFVNHNLGAAGNVNFGGFLFFQRYFTEHTGLRYNFKYVRIEGKYGSPEQTSNTNAFSGGLDFIYNFVPCESVTPYAALGVGGVYYSWNNRADATLDDSYISLQINTSLGIEWKIGRDWKFLTEFGYHTITDNYFDGMRGSDGAGGLLGVNNDTYLSINLGFLYYFDKGLPSRLCQIYSGLSVPPKTEPIDYARIENIVERHIPKEVEKQIVVEKPVEVSSRWVLVGVNFDANSARLRPEAYPILLHAVQTLLRNPDMRVEIQGYTDNTGSERTNQILSEKRANAVRDYLVARGIMASRLRAVGYGETRPIADNGTASGRAMNRRIEFRILN